MTATRLPSGGAIDRAAPLAFRFDGKPCSGFAGDTIASALLASGVAIVGRSFKYHRPRGIWGAWTEEPNAILDVTRAGKTTPNLRATTEALEAGLVARSVNTSPDAATDRSSLIGLGARFLPAGFYYKTFMLPNWEAFEPRIRAMAGLGRLYPNNEPPADCPQFNAHCDLLVVGAGPAGLAAARAGARAGRGVWLIDDRAQAGGSLLHRGGSIDGGDGPAFAAEVLADVAARGGRVLLDTTAFGVYDHGLVCAWQRRAPAPDALWRIRASETIVATGAIERPLVVPDNDRPGVMSADAALVYLERHALRVGERVVVATNNDSAYPVAEAFAAAGARVVIVDSRRDGPQSSVEVRRGARIEAVDGRRGVAGVRIGEAYAACDALLMSGGWSPTAHLYAQARGRLVYDEARAALVPGAPVEGLKVAGAANGAFTLDAALREGHAAANGAGAAPNAPAGQYRIAPDWPEAKAGGRRWIDFENDVTLKDVALAAREGYQSVEHLKRYTTLGMATDQGKTSNVNGLAALAAMTGRPIAEVGATTFRPPYVPTPLPVVAGRRRGALMNPLKRLPLEGAHRADGAVLREYGGWLRPAWYGEGDPQQTIAREAAQARDSVGLFDGSSLGKLELVGPEAAALADFHSYNRLSTLREGRIRYGFMLTENGVVYDDGVTLRLAPDRFLVSCSSGHAAAIRQRLELWRQDRFDPARVFVHDATAHWATLTASGPRSRELLTAAGLDVDLSDDALPHMAFATGRYMGAPLRVARVSFTGDRSYEVSVPLGAAAALRARLKDALAGVRGALLGLEAVSLLRAEKGYVIVGKDTDGLTMPGDLGVTAPRDARADEYIGKRGLFMPVARDPRRRQFVGLGVASGEPMLPTGAHAVDAAGNSRRSAGYVTSSYDSPTLKRPIALGLIEDGLSRMGEEIRIYHLGAERRATIVSPVFLDVEGARLNA